MSVCVCVSVADTLKILLEFPVIVNSTLYNSSVKKYLKNVFMQTSVLTLLVLITTLISFLTVASL